MSNNSTPNITVVVPLYNEEKFVSETLDSILNQEYEDWECIIVNDCSTDNSELIAKSFLDRDKRFRLIRHSKNKGLAATRNTGLFRANSKYITFLDSDDYLTPNSLKTRLAVLEHAPNDVAGSYCNIIIGPEEGLPAIYQERINAKSKATIIDYYTTQGSCPFNAHAPLLKTSILKAANGFDERLRHGAEDWEFWIRLMRNGYRFFPTKRYSAVYRQKKKSMAKTQIEGHSKVAYELLSSIDRRMKSSHRLTNAPFQFIKPISYYQSKLRILPRQLTYITYYYLANDKKALNSELKKLPKGIFHLIKHHIEFGKIIKMAICKYQCRDFFQEWDYLPSEYQNNYQEILRPVTAELGPG